MRNYISKFKFLDMPVYYCREDYYISIKEYMDSIYKYKDIISVYQCGNISVEGISDVDLIIVVKDHLTESLNHSFNISKFNERIQYVFMHNPFIMDKRIFKNLYKIFIINNMKLVYGNELLINNIRPNMQKYYELCVNIQRLSLFVRKFSHDLVYKKLMVRNLLTVLNSLNFTISSVMKICDIRRDNWCNYINDIKELRREWFKADMNENCEKIVNLIKDALSICYELIEYLDVYLKKEHLIIIKGMKDIQYFESFKNLIFYSDIYKYIDMREKLSFFRNIDIMRFNKKMNTILKNFLELSITFLPLSFYKLQIISLHELEIYKTHGDKLILAAFDRRSLMEHHMKFLIANNFEYGSFIPYSSFIKNYKYTSKFSLLIRILEMYNKYYFQRKIGSVEHMCGCSMSCGTGP